MRFRRFAQLIVCSAALLAGIVPHTLAAQSGATQPASAPVATGLPSTASPQQAYSLPPEKLAKAIAISRIRNILSITGSVWGLVFLGLLLATRALSGAGEVGRSEFRTGAGFRERSSSRRS